MYIVCFYLLNFCFALLSVSFFLSYGYLILFFRTMAPPHGEGNERVNIRVNDLTPNDIHKAAVTRDYIKQPRLSKK